MIKKIVEDKNLIEITKQFENLLVNDEENNLINFVNLI